MAVTALAWPWPRPIFSIRCDRQLTVLLEARLRQDEGEVLVRLAGRLLGIGEIGLEAPCGASSGRAACVSPDMRRAGFASPPSVFATFLERWASRGALNSLPSFQFGPFGRFGETVGHFVVDLRVGFDPTHGFMRRSIRRWAGRSRWSVYFLLAASPAAPPPPTRSMPLSNLQHRHAFLGEAEIVRAIEVVHFCGIRVRA